MREAIGGAWLYSIVIVFIVLFTSFLAVSVNYSKAFRVKDRIITIIENNEGLNSDTQEKISEFLSTNGYFVYGTCAKGEKGYEQNSSMSAKYKYCVSKKESGSSLPSSTKKTYYRVKVFFRIDLPIIGNLFIFPVSGETKAVYFATDDI